MNIDIEEALYEQVAIKIQAGDILQGLWLKANVDANGNEQIAKAKYAKLRVAQLTRDYEALELLKASEIKNQELKKQEQVIKALKLKRCELGKEKNGGYILYEPDGGCKPFTSIDALNDYVQNKC